MHRKNEYGYQHNLDLYGGMMFDAFSRKAQETLAYRALEVWIERAGEVWSERASQAWDKTDSLDGTDNTLKRMVEYLYSDKSREKFVAACGAETKNNISNLRERLGKSDVTAASGFWGNSEFCDRLVTTVSLLEEAHRLWEPSATPFKLEEVLKQSRGLQRKSAELEVVAKTLAESHQKTTELLKNTPMGRRVRSALKHYGERGEECWQRVLKTSMASPYLNVKPVLNPLHGVAAGGGA
jgi:hypothetical protein